MTYARAGMHVRCKRGQSTCLPAQEWGDKDAAKEVVEDGGEDGEAWTRLCLGEMLESSSCGEATRCPGLVKLIEEDLPLLKAKLDKLQCTMAEGEREEAERENLKASCEKLENYKKEMLHVHAWLKPKLEALLTSSPPPEEAIRLLFGCVCKWEELTDLVSADQMSRFVGEAGKHIDGAVWAMLSEKLKPDVEMLLDPQRMFKELHDVLMKPIAGALEGDKEVLIIPHGDLLLVPWAALQDDEGQYLIQKHVIRVSPSLRVARAAADAVAAGSQQQQERRAVVIGNPKPTKSKELPGSEEEARRVAGITSRTIALRHSIVLLLGEDATALRVLEEMKGASWMHFAGHATSESLLLAGKQELTMQQVQELKLAIGAIVVLSGCDTLRGRIRPEGTLGVARAFLLAGAGSVVASLWRIEDMRTTWLMQQFYQRLHGNPQGGDTDRVTVAQAMQGAMKTCIQLKVCPSVWAAFLVTGA